MKSWLFSALGIVVGILMLSQTTSADEKLPMAIFAAACLTAGAMYRNAESRERTTDAFRNFGKPAADTPRILTAKTIVERVSLSLVKGKNTDGK